MLKVQGNNQYNYGKENENLQVVREKEEKKKEETILARMHNTSYFHDPSTNFINTLENKQMLFFTIIIIKYNINIKWKFVYNDISKRNLRLLYIFSLKYFCRCVRAMCKMPGL